MFKRLLIANRGEIACRIIKSAQQLNIVTLAIYSDVDVNALYVHQADEAYAIGPAPALESYLNIPNIIALAKKVHADAIHPGYGFLAENAAFAKACEEAGIIFVGPSSEHIQMMGLKDEAKKIAKKYGCPVLPEYNEADLSFPLLIKPIAGGGGKGMQIVEAALEFPEKLASAKRQALNSFGNDAVLLEKYLAKPRHIEIQILADKNGHAIYLFERDCSLQRRYQKVIEQAPALAISPLLREKMGLAALGIVKGLGYVGAGTIEFLLDEDDEFYFMEMNTRLQVEHGVTELITDVDLVTWQLRIASGEALSLQQSDLVIQGVAIEARLYAEDPSEDFLPATGEIVHLHWPTGVRVDNGIKVGDQVTIYYDPLLAKIIVHAENHANAWLALTQALSQVQLAGVKTNLNFLRTLALTPQITQGPVDTHFIDTHPELAAKKAINIEEWLLALMAILLKQKSEIFSISPWSSHSPWRLNATTVQKISFYQGQQKQEFTIEYGKKDYKIHVEDKTYSVQSAELLQDQLSAQIHHQEYQRRVIFQDHRIWLLGKEKDILFTLPETGSLQAIQKDDPSLRAPMPGRIIQILVNEQQSVSESQPLVIIEAMKMEHTLRAPHAGTVKTLYFKTGDAVQEGDKVVEISVDA